MPRRVAHPSLYDVKTCGPPLFVRGHAIDVTEQSAMGVTPRVRGFKAGAAGHQTRQHLHQLSSSDTWQNHASERTKNALTALLQLGNTVPSSQYLDMLGVALDQHVDTF